MEIKKVRAAVLGGGAAGHAAAIGFSRRLGSGSTVIIEKQERTGRKLLATGNGRCNISNENVSPEHYHGDKNIIGSVISRFSVSDLKDFFAGLGVLLRSDREGRLYPYSNQASTILDALRSECRRRNVEEICRFSAVSIKKENGLFTISSDGLVISSEYLVIAAGSKASPSLGSDDSGTKLLEDMGIRSTPVFPSLCPITAKEKYPPLKGVRATGTVTLLADGKKILSREGEIQFSEHGLSGICVFELSRYVSEFFFCGSINGTKYREISIAADVLKDYSFRDVCAYLEGIKKLRSSENADTIFSGALNSKLASVIAGYCGLSGKKCSSLTPHDIKQLASASKKLIFTPIRSDDFRTAQVCAGGIGSEYIDPCSLMSRKYKNLFVCGELLDADGDCGGFNLHFAIGSGLLAAENA